MPTQETVLEPSQSKLMFLFRLRGGNAGFQRIHELALSRFCSAILAAAAFAAMVAPVHAQSCPEVPGFGDIEGLPVYEGACLFGAEDAGFSNHQLPIGPMKGRSLSASKPLEGELQRRLYVAPERASSLDVFQNYRNALTELGFQTLYQCSGAECGSRNGLLGKLVIYSSDRVLTNLGQESQFALYSDGGEHYLAAQSADGTRHVALYVTQNKIAPISKTASGRAAAHLDVITAKGLEKKMVDAAAMAKGISDEGHVVVDNVYFDFGTATLTPEAAPALSEMVRFLVENPKIKVFIVGHTDWVGKADDNLSLSQRRAQAVVSALVKAGIVPDRVTAEGVGQYAPRASNATEAGRTLNRRVELVER